MSVIEVESWRIKPGLEDQHHDIIRQWFVYVREHHAELFREWRSARYYRELDADTKEPTGRYIMLFEFESEEGRQAYKKRRGDFTGPYAEYKSVDPYHRFFDHDTVELEFWEPQEEDRWLVPD